MKVSISQWLFPFAVFPTYYSDPWDGRHEKLYLSELDFWRYRSGVQPGDKSSRWKDLWSWTSHRFSLFGVAYYGSNFTSYLLLRSSFIARVTSLFDISYSHLCCPVAITVLLLQRNELHQIAVSILFSCSPLYNGIHNWWAVNWLRIVCECVCIHISSSFKIIL